MDHPEKRRDALEVELARAASQSENKTQLLRTVSHDLRQPLHVLNLMLDYLADTKLDARQKMALRHARAACDAGSGLLNSLLEYSRLEAGIIESKPVPVSVHSILKDIETRFAPVAEAKGLLFRVRESGLGTVVDAKLLVQALSNLVSNAFKFTHVGGVLLACRSSGEHVVFEVWDTGIGVSLNQQQEIFKEFWQGREASFEKDADAGYGLGLTIVDRLAKLMGARLSVRSEVGRGSVFRLFLPLCRDVVIEDAEELGEASVSLPGLKVLLIDEIEASRIALHHLITGWGCDCEAHAKLDPARLEVAAQQTDVVVIDLHRSKRDGSDPMLAFRTIVVSQVPVIAITGDTAPERLRALQAGKVAVLLKPLTSMQLNKALSEMAARD